MKSVKTCFQNICIAFILWIYKIFGTKSWVCHMTPYKWILMHFASYQKMMTNAWMSAMLFDSLGFYKDFTLHPSRGSSAIDLLCPLSLPLKEMLPRRPRPPLAVTFIILAWQWEHEWSVPLKNKIDVKTVAVMREALQFTTPSFSCFLFYTNPLVWLLAIWASVLLSSSGVLHFQLISVV